MNRRGVIPPPRSSPSRSAWSPLTAAGSRPSPAGENSPGSTVMRTSAAAGAYRPSRRGAPSPCAAGPLIPTGRSLGTVTHGREGRGHAPPYPSITIPSRPDDRGWPDANGKPLPCPAITIPSRPDGLPFRTTTG